MNWLATLTSVGVAFIPLLLLVFMITSASFARLVPGKMSTYTLITFGFLWLCTLVTLGLIIFNGPIDGSLLNFSQVSIFGFLADRLSLVLVLLVITVSGTVHLYSLRAMQEEQHFQRYFTLLTLITLEVVLVVLANNLLMLGIFWIIKGLTLTLLLAHYRHRPASRRAALKKLSIDLIGDAAFIAALALTWDIFGTFELKAINSLAANATQNQFDYRMTLLTALLFVAIMAKSAQFPLHSWLPDSVEAPTPVSALMHAGLINAGGFLFIRLSSLFLATPLTMGLAIAIGGFTAFYGTLLMLTRPDVKGMLVYSTMGQMGFMILECGLGVFVLATLHLVAHGLFKATLFLSSGSIIQQKSTLQLIAPPQQHSSNGQPTARFLLVGLLAAITLFLAPVLIGFSLSTGTILLAFAWITLAWAFTEINSLPLALLLPGTVIVSLLYLVSIHAIEGFFSPAIATNPVIDTTLAVVCAGGLVSVGLIAIVLKNSNRPDWLNKLFTKLYVRLLFTGYGK